jgi:hypothetical protein
MRDMGKESPANRIERSLKGTLQAVAFGAIACPLGLGLLYWLVETKQRLPDDVHFGLGLTGVLLLIVGLAAFSVAASSSGTAACPSCGRKLQRLDESGVGRPRLCRGCLSYVESRDGSLLLVPPDRVESAPAFRVALPKELAWPDGCCVCAGHAARKVDVHLDVSGHLGSAIVSAGGMIAGGTLGMGVTVSEEGRASLAVPHCEQHADGAALELASTGQVRLLFRSYPYLRAFCDLNALKPG